MQCGKPSRFRPSDLIIFSTILFNTLRHFSPCRQHTKPAHISVCKGDCPAFPSPTCFLGKAAVPDPFLQVAKSGYPGINVAINHQTSTITLTDMVCARVQGSAVQFPLPVPVPQAASKLNALSLLSKQHASGAVSEGELWRFAGQMGRCVPRLRRVILAD